MAHMRGVLEEEDASKLQLGPDFSRAKCLLNADVAIILERKREAMEGKGQQPKSDFLKAYTYVNKVKQFRDRHVVVQVRKDLEAYGLEPFEVAQLGNLCPENALEAKALIPSLDMPDRERLGMCDVDNTQLTELLQELAANKQFST
eukprot:CAMPEP_0115845958 /NCGR_PEP_ID=MMETSP0287-20121206/9618_1 /TAXON_ID=412157 /ORGANISM="Chrysochromulina rotalis, Strain UIO044" /LENGTH=145 /DNA_ID=CAMNT_0003299743 /DNA_START=62 /DNA_END=499 /DNA_ORIENTATION=+